jgi:hypothetical protein
VRTQDPSAPALASFVCTLVRTRCNGEAPFAYARVVSRIEAPVVTVMASTGWLQRALEPCLGDVEAVVGDERDEQRAGVS